MHLDEKSVLPSPPPNPSNRKIDSSTNNENIAEQQQEKLLPLPKFVQPQSTSATASSSSRPGSIDDSFSSVSNSSPTQSPLSSSTTTQLTGSPEIETKLANSFSANMRLPSISLGSNGTKFDHHSKDYKPPSLSNNSDDHLRVTLPLPRRLSSAYSSSSDSFSSCATSCTTDQLQLPSIMPPLGVSHSIDSPWSWKSHQPARLSVLLNTDNFHDDNFDSRYRRASLGALPCTSASPFLPSLSSITYTVSSTRAKLSPNSLGRRISIGGEPKKDCERNNSSGSSTSNAGGLYKSSHIGRFLNRDPVDAGSNFANIAGNNYSRFNKTLGANGNSHVHYNDKESRVVEIDPNQPSDFKDISNNSSNNNNNSNNNNKNITNGTNIENNQLKLPLIDSGRVSKSKRPSIQNLIHATNQSPYS